MLYMHDPENNSSANSASLEPVGRDNTELSPNGADPDNETESAVCLIGFETLRAVKQVKPRAAHAQHPAAAVCGNLLFRLLTAAHVLPLVP